MNDDTDLALVTAQGNPLHLTDEEQMFVYQTEVIGLPVKRAGEISGVNGYVIAKRPHIIAAREQARLMLRGDTDFTREDVAAGYKRAIDQAYMLGDPMAQIAGWREMAKLKGFDKHVNINLHLTGTPEQVRRQIKEISTADLMQMTGEKVLDAEFYRLEAPSDAT